MKKLYSIILMFSFLVGTVQPVLPMIEYHLFEGDIIGFFHSDGSETNEEGEAMCTAAEISAPFQSNDEEPDLLDTDYYPIPVKSSEENALTILPVMGEQYVFVTDRMITHARDPSSPPPKME